MPPSQHPWTIAALAATALVSRATLAARFTEHVGMPPIAYLTRWRLALARDRLADRRATLAEIAGDVGYGSPFALSTAFEQPNGTEGLSPGGCALLACAQGHRE